MNRIVVDVDKGSKREEGYLKQGFTFDKSKHPVRRQKRRLVKLIV